MSSSKSMMATVVMGCATIAGVGPSALILGAHSKLAITLYFIILSPLIGFLLGGLFMVITIWLYIIIPKGLLPQQDTGRIMGNLVADQSISFQAMREKLSAYVAVVKADPAVEHVVAFSGGGQRNSAFFFVALKPQAQREAAPDSFFAQLRKQFEHKPGALLFLQTAQTVLKPFTQRKISADEIIARLRKKLAHEPGATLFLQAAQDVRIGSRRSNAQYQYTLSADDIGELRDWEPRIRQALSNVPEIVDVSTDAQDLGLQTSLVIDRNAAAHLGDSAP